MQVHNFYIGSSRGISYSRQKFPSAFTETWKTWDWLSSGAYNVSQPWAVGDPPLKHICLLWRFRSTSGIIARNIKKYKSLHQILEVSNIHKYAYVASRVSPAFAVLEREREGMEMGRNSTGERRDLFGFLLTPLSEEHKDWGPTQ